MSYFMGCRFLKLDILLAFDSIPPFLAFYIAHIVTDRFS